MHEAASAHSDAMLNKLNDPSGLVNLYSLKNRMSLFSGEDVLQEADKVLQAIIDRYFADEIKFADIADPTERSRLAFARYKGEAENALLAAGFPHVYIFRPVTSIRCSRGRNRISATGYCARSTPRFGSCSPIW